MKEKKTAYALLYWLSIIFINALIFESIFSMDTFIYKDGSITFPFSVTSLTLVKWLPGSDIFSHPICAWGAPVHQSNFYALAIVTSLGQIFPLRSMGHTCIMFFSETHFAFQEGNKSLKGMEFVQKNHWEI